MDHPTQDHEHDHHHPHEHQDRHEHAEHDAPHGEHGRHRHEDHAHGPRAEERRHDRHHDHGHPGRADAYDYDETGGTGEDSYSPHAHHHHGGELQPRDMTPGQHAFIMLGTKTLFLCHMTMFDMEEHCYQIILEATLPPRAMAHYLRSRHATPDETLFLGNSPKDLLTVADFMSGSRRAFNADIFRGAPNRPKSEGWPWKDRPGYAVIEDVPVVVERVVYARHFDFGLEYPKHLTYILFGAGDEAHVTHFQTKDPDFDHIASLQESPRWLPQKKLRAGVHVTTTIPRYGDAPPCANPLEAGCYEVLYQGQGALREIHVGHTWWYSTAICNHVDPCAE